MKIVGIGTCVHDTLLNLSQFPQEDTKLRADTQCESGGGPCATALVAARTLGIDTAYIGSLADDAAGKFLLRDFERFGVDTQYIRVQHDCQSFVSYVMLSRATRTRTIVAYAGSVPPVVPDAAQKSAIRDADILLVDGNELEAAIEGAKLIRAAGGHVLYDAGGLYKDVQRLVPLADILIPSEEFACGYTHTECAEEAAQALYTQYSPAVVVVTCGKRGCVLCDDEGVRSYPAFSVDAVDTNGAGDVFHGAFAVGILHGLSHMQCCIFASAVSALKCMGLGARESVPHLKKTIQFLKECGYDEFEKIMEL